MKKGAYLVVLMLAVVVVGATGCGLFVNRYDRELKRFLPNVSGFTWKYSGFSGYDHEMSLRSIEARRGLTKYHIAGTVGDPSGGEAVRDRSLTITYIINDGVWTQEKQEESMMDSEFDRLELLRGPIVEGTTWSQEQVDQEGRRRVLDSLIEDIRLEPRRVVVVVYRERGTPYFERREFTEGVGVTLFEKLWMSPLGNFEIGYTLFQGF
ncbi:MAG: hypothetical protein KGZ92_10115 [Firmicutes bacterium]|nr:hypothetical protein [Dethiobacter sp.]MBS3889619.1 hypothetical protein [Bacillota bacterium]MBS4055386.1 hypothetical protein [Thermaerobacter sp.]